MARFTSNESNMYIVREKRRDPFLYDLHNEGVFVSLACQYSSHLNIHTLKLDP